MIDGATPELAESAAARLTAASGQTTRSCFLVCAGPMAGAFFNQNGLLFLPLAEVQDTTQQLFKAQPFLGALAADPSLRGIMASLSTALLGVSAGQAKLADLDVPMARFADSFGAAAHGQVELSVLALADHRAPPQAGGDAPLHRGASPALDFNALEPGKKRQRRDPRRRPRAGPDAGQWRAGPADRRRAAVG